LGSCRTLQRTCCANNAERVAGAFPAALTVSRARRRCVKLWVPHGIPGAQGTEAVVQATSARLLASLSKGGRVPRPRHNGIARSMAGRFRLWVVQAPGSPGTARGLPERTGATTRSARSSPSAPQGQGSPSPTLTGIAGEGTPLEEQEVVVGVGEQTPHGRQPDLDAAAETKRRVGFDLFPLGHMPIGVA